jgi:activator of HSP90 ATPase
MTTKTIRQQILLPAAPGEIYELLIDQKKHAAFSGVGAKISRKVGGAFHCFDGYTAGINVELVPRKRIVQVWRARDWPAGTFSLVTFALARASGGRTKLTFTHVGVPASDYKSKCEGWRTFYWERMRKYLGE